MHIIALASYLSTRRGGLERSLLDVCQNLAARGHKVTLVYEQEEDQLGAYQEFCDSTLKIKSYRLNPSFGLDILRVPVEPQSLIYSNQYNNFFFGSILALIRNKPFVCHLRLHASTERTKIKRLKQAATLSQIDRYIAISDAVKADWENRLAISPQKIDVVYNGIDSAQFFPVSQPEYLKAKWGITQGERVVSYVGRIETDKGLETLIRAFSLLLKSGVKAKLLVAGKSLFSGESYQASLVNLAEQEGIGNSVKFLGHLSNPREIYHLSDVNVLPSLWLEAFGRVIIESMACGTPALGSRVGGIPEILTGEFSDWLFNRGDELDLYDKLKSVIDWRETAPYLAERCRQHVLKNFSIEQTIDGIESVLLRAVNP